MNINKEIINEDKTSDNAWVYYKRANLHYYNKDLDNAIMDFQKAMTLADDYDDYNKFYYRLAEICCEKQSAQTFETRMAPYAQMIEKIKKEASKSLCDIFKFKTREEYAELAAVLALYEKYELLKRLLDETANSQFPALTSRFIISGVQTSILNTPVRPQFAFWGPTPFYFITAKTAREKIKDPKKILKYLIDKGADINCKAADGSAALINQTCSDCESTEMLQTLLEFGADPNQSCLFYDNEWTPLTHCLSPCSEEEKDMNGENISVIIPFNDFAVKQAKLLLDHGADPNLTSPNMPNYPPLIIAIRYGFITKGGSTKGKPAESILELIELLIQKGADVNFMDSENNTPLSIATDNNLQSVIELLKKYKAKTFEEIDEERKAAEKEIRLKNPPLEGAERKKSVEELKEKLLAVSRNATFFIPKKCHAPPPSQQIFTSHIGGVPYFEKGAEWPCDNRGKPFQFIYQIFQDSGNSLALPEGVKLLQLFYDWEKEEEYIALYHDLNTENAVLIDFPYFYEDKDTDDDEDVEDDENTEDYEYLENSLEYMELSFRTVKMIPDSYYDLGDISPETIILAQKIHPGSGEKILKNLCGELGIIEPERESCLGGFFCHMSNSWAPEISYKEAEPLFQLYLESDGDGPYGWKRWDDAMIYAWYNKTKDVNSHLVINYD